MRDVFVNGVQVLRDGEHTGAKPGRALWGPGQDRHARRAGGALIVCQDGDMMADIGRACAALVALQAAQVEPAGACGGRLGSAAAVSRSVVTADELALDFDHWAAVVRGNYESELSTSQTESLGAIDRKLATMSRDGVEFDVELWTDAAVRTSEHWAGVRRLAVAGLEAFGWPVEASPASPDDRGTMFVGE